MWFLNLVLLAVRLSVSVDGFSTCQSYDLHGQKSKRIEAVRGQILSKLRIRSPPDIVTSPSTESVPFEVMLLYNSTRELLKQSARQADSSCDRESSEEDYYAKEVQRVEMLPQRSDSNTISGVPSPYLRVLQFDFSGVEQNASALSRAEFRIYRIPNPQANSAEQRVEIYQILRPDDVTGPAQRYIASWTVQPQAKGAWLSVDVTETVKDWMTVKGRNLGLKLSVHCSCCTFDPSTNSITPSRTDALQARFAGVDDDPQRSNRGGGQVKGQIQFSTKAPHLILTLLPPGRLDPPAKKSRQRRAAAETSTCSRGSDQSCCLRSLYIDFRRDLNWKWIHEPKGYRANFCAGTCPYLWSTDNHYSMDLEPLTIVYFLGRTPRVEQLSNMVVRSCKCR